MHWLRGIAALGLAAPLALSAGCSSSGDDAAGASGRAGTGQGGESQAGAPGGGTNSGSGVGGAAAGLSGSAGRGGSPSKGGSGGQENGAGKSGSPTGNRGGNDAQGPGPEGFCAAWIDAFATFLQRCSCDAPTIARYREVNAALCEPGGFLEPLPAAVSAGDFTYDPNAAAALFDRLADDAAPCVDESFRALRLDSEELYSLGGVFLGTHRLGEACAHPVGFKGGVSDCREGFCASDGAGAGVCISFVAEGQPCDDSGADNFHADVARLCHEVRGPDHDGEYESAFDVFACRAGANGAEATCVRELADGEPCETHESCRSERCADPGDGTPVCATPRADGEPCDVHEQCASGACELDPPRVCGATFPNGTECAYANGACSSGYCDTPDSGEPVCLPAPSQSVGDSCTVATDCITLGHGESRDNLCSAGRCVNDICAAYLE